MENRGGIADPPVLERTYARPQLGADSAPSRDPLAEANGKEQRLVDTSGPRGVLLRLLVLFHDQLIEYWLRGYLPSSSCSISWLS